MSKGKENERREKRKNGRRCTEGGDGEWEMKKGEDEEEGEREIVRERGREEKERWEERKKGRGRQEGDYGEWKMKKGDEEEKIEKEREIEGEGTKRKKGKRCVQRDDR